MYLPIQRIANWTTFEKKINKKKYASDSVHRFDRRFTSMPPHVTIESFKITPLRSMHTAQLLRRSSYSSYFDVVHILV